MAPPNRYIPDLSDADWKKLAVHHHPAIRYHPADRTKNLVCIGHLDTYHGYPVHAYIVRSNNESNVSTTPRMFHIPRSQLLLPGQRIAYLFMEPSDGELEELHDTLILAIMNKARRKGKTSLYRKPNLGLILDPVVPLKYLSRGADRLNILPNLLPYCYAARVAHGKGEIFQPVKALKDAFRLHDEQVLEHVEGVPVIKRSASAELYSDDGVQGGVRKRTQSQTVPGGRMGSQMWITQNPAPLDMPHGSDNETENEPRPSQELVHRPKSARPQHHPLRHFFPPIASPAGLRTHHVTNAANNGNHNPKHVNNNCANNAGGNSSSSTSDDSSSSNPSPPASDPSTTPSTTLPFPRPTPNPVPSPPAPIPGTTSAVKPWTSSFEVRKTALVLREQTANKMMEDFEAWASQSEENSAALEPAERDEMKTLRQRFRGDMHSFMSKMADGQM